MPEVLTPTETQLNIQEFCTVTSGNLSNVNNAFDNNPATYATFTPSSASLSVTLVNSYWMPSGTGTISFAAGQYVLLSSIDYGIPASPSGAPLSQLGSDLPDFYGGFATSTETNLAYDSGLPAQPMLLRVFSGVQSVTAPSLVTVGDGPSAYSFPMGSISVGYYYGYTSFGTLIDSGTSGMTQVESSTVDDFNQWFNTETLGSAANGSYSVTNTGSYGQFFWVTLNPATPRFLHVKFPEPLWLTRIGYMGDGDCVGIASDCGIIPNEGLILDLTSFIPLEITPNVYELQFDPPFPYFSDGIWIFPDYLNGANAANPVNLNELQIFYATEEYLNMALPTKNFITLGVKSIGILPWSASSSYPFTGAVVNAPLSLQSLDLSYSSKVWEELGGEDVYLNGIYEYERRVGGKFSVQRINFQLITDIMAGTLIVGSSGTVNEQTYTAPNYSDVNPYFTLFATSTEGDGSQLVVLPKCKLNSSFSDVWDRTKGTPYDIGFESVWDTTYIRQDGVVGGILERVWANNNSVYPLHS